MISSAALPAVLRRRRFLLGGLPALAVRRSGGVSGLSSGTKSETGKSRLIRDSFVAVVIDDETCRAAIGQGGSFCQKSEEECRVQAHASSHRVKLESGPALAVVRDN